MPQHSLRTKPWNRVNLPVYSIASKYGECENMHIITYATAISMKPKKFICGVYEGTRTLELITKSGLFVLQILSDQQYRLVDLLGKKSGHDIDKIARLKKRGLIVEWEGFSVLKDCLSCILLKVEKTISGGDHTIFITEVISYKNFNQGVALSLDDLRKHRLIRI
jgi:flavin reductase (DIM6/NTAB) family NADH-FMN oxidoreductase RutF